MSKPSFSLYVVEVASLGLGQTLDRCSPPPTSHIKKHTAWEMVSSRKCMSQALLGGLIRFDFMGAVKLSHRRLFLKAVKDCVTSMLHCFVPPALLAW